MARVVGPLFSMSASGTIGDAVTYGNWKGIPWARVWFVPFNPQSVKQTNVRGALTLLVNLWQTLTDGTKIAWNEFAEGSKKSGFNQFVGRGMDQYIEQLGADVSALSVTVANVAPEETWTWTEVV